MVHSSKSYIVLFSFFLVFIATFLLGNISFARVASVDVSEISLEDRYPVAVGPVRNYNSLVLQRLRNSDNLFGENFQTIGTVYHTPQPTPEPQYANYTTITNSAELVRINKIVCDRIPYSPLCNNPYLQDRLRKISDERGVPFWLMVGITLAESRVGTDFAGGCDASYYNWGGVKARRLDSGEIIRDYPIPDFNGCWLYKFDSVEDYWVSNQQHQTHQIYLMYLVYHLQLKFSLFLTYVLN